MSRYTNIGEVVVTSTVLGKAKVQAVQNRNMRKVILSLLVLIVLGLVVAVWLGRGKQKLSGSELVTAAPVLDQPEDKRMTAPHTAQPEKAVHSPVVKPDASKAPAEVSQPPSLQQQAKNEFNKAQQLAQQGKINGAIEGYRSSLLLDAGNDTARQAMIDLLMKSGRKADAERALQLGLKNTPNSSSYSLQLARLLADRNEQAAALEVMQRTLPYAANQAEYQAFYASLLRGQGRHNDAVTYYQKALGLKPGTGEWLMNMGISLQASGRAGEAQDAFKNALETHTLGPQARAFVEKQINPPVRAPEPLPAATPPVTPQTAPQ